MNKIEFTRIGPNNLKIPDPTSDQYILLSYFMEGYKFGDQLERIISKLESFRSGQEIFESFVTDKWNFGNGAGYFECDQETAYLLPNSTNFQPVIMPLRELIALFKQWKSFLQSK